MANDTSISNYTENFSQQVNISSKAGALVIIAHYMDLMVQPEYRDDVRGGNGLAFKRAIEVLGYVLGPHSYQAEVDAVLTDIDQPKIKAIQLANKTLGKCSGGIVMPTSITVEGAVIIGELIEQAGGGVWTLGERGEMWGIQHPEKAFVFTSQGVEQVRQKSLNTPATNTVAKTMQVQPAQWNPITGVTLKGQPVPI
jgi:hypothetical protein